MELEEVNIDCKKYNAATKNRNDFFVARYIFNYETNNCDKEYLDNIITAGEDLALKVNPAAANGRTTSRPLETLKNNGIAGILAEELWKKYINEKSNNIIVRSTEFESASSQIDLEIISNNKKIEVRSSFPRNGIDFAICHPYYEFDIIGPYNNSVKPGEIAKDFYLRTLYHIKSGETFLGNLKKDNFKVYLAGGATWEMMTNPKYYLNKDLKPEDFILQSDAQYSSYRVVPYSRALTTEEMYDLITKK